MSDKSPGAEAKKAVFWNQRRDDRLNLFLRLILAIELPLVIIVLVSWRSEVSHLDTTTSQLKNEFVDFKKSVKKDQDERTQQHLDERAVSCRVVKRLNIEEPLCSMQVLPTTVPTTSTTQAP